jgi:5-methylthioadenosine/S-adenosylhomocysteine deaminase
MARPILLAGGTVVTMAPDRRLISDGAVLVDGKRIARVGKAADLKAEASGAELVDTTDCLVIPGLIDAHNHPAHFLSKGLLDDVETGRRWATRLYPFDTKIGPEQCYWGSQGTFAEMIRSGTTCFADPGGYFPEATIRAAEEIGIRGVVTRSTTDLHDPARPTPDAHMGSTADVVELGRSLHEKYNGTADGRIRVWLGLRSVTATSDGLCRAIRDEAQRLGVGIHIHLAVNPNETTQCLAKWGARPVERYERLGLLAPNLFAVHMGAIDDSEVELVARRGVKVGHCPSASMLGAFGSVAHGKFPDLVAAGVTIAIGSDAAAISRFLDLIRVMYLAACAHKDAQYDAEVMGAHKAFEMATIDGARALLWDDEIGSLEQGKLADLAIVECTGLEWHPRPHFNPIANLVYSSSGAAVRSVMIDGRFVMRDRQLLTIDETTLRAGTAKAAREAVTMAGLPEEVRWPVI